MYIFLAFRIKLIIVFLLLLMILFSINEHEIVSNESSTLENVKFLIYVDYAFFFVLK